MARRRIKRARRGRYQIELPAEERAVLRQLVAELGMMLTGEEMLGADPGLRRLFPPAYTDEPEAEAEYRDLMHEDLVERRRAALNTVTETLEAAEVDAEQLSGWLSAINDLRLVIGTKLDVQEGEGVDIDPEDPDAATRAIYLYLSMLEEEVVEALAKG
jgi:uncharacterized protein DUF2017